MGQGTSPLMENKTSLRGLQEESSETQLLTIPKKEILHGKRPPTNNVKLHREPEVFATNNLTATDHWLWLFSQQSSNSSNWAISSLWGWWRQESKKKLSLNQRNVCLRAWLEQLFHTGKRMKVAHTSQMQDHVTQLRLFPRFSRLQPLHS